jgi:Arc/MetJ family transcription regulator
MRTSIDIDDRLLSQARKLTGLRTKREIVHRALEVLVQSKARRGILRFRGSGIWDGDAVKRRRSVKEIFDSFARVRMKLPKGMTVKDLINELNQEGSP